MCLCVCAFRTWCVTINRVMNEGFDTFNARYFQLFDIIRQFSFLHTIHAGNQEFLIVEFPFIRRKCRWQRPKNPESDIFSLFSLFFVSFLDRTNANLRFQMRQIWRWVMSSAPDCGGTYAIKQKRKKEKSKTLNKGKFQLVIRISHHFVRINLRSDDSALISMFLI